MSCKMSVLNFVLFFIFIIYYSFKYFLILNILIGAYSKQDVKEKIFLNGLKE